MKQTIKITFIKQCSVCGYQSRFNVSSIVICRKCGGIMENIEGNKLDKDDMRPFVGIIEGRR